ncbi:MAG: MotA/TolQ/ExbB proton channel family protein [Gammaproteobacteria bacterium]
MSLTYVFQQDDLVLLGVFLTLVAMSVLTWYFVFLKAIRLVQIRRANGRFAAAFWDAESLESAQALATSSPAPLARLANAGLAALRHFQNSHHTRLGDACSTDEFLVRTLRNALNREGARLQAGQTVLASIGSTAPFVGLFGTVWGIYHALLRISEQGSASMEMVAGPLGEALVATAAGLAVAIPAVLAFNAFSRRNRVLVDELDAFAHDIHAFLTTGTNLHNGGQR